MSRALILSEKSQFNKKEEKELAAAKVQVAVRSKVSEDFLQNGPERFDIVVLDDSLRGVDVSELCRKLRDATGAFIILLGNVPTWEMWDKKQEIGFDQYYRKPVLLKELVTKIKLAAYEVDYRARLATPETDTPPVEEKVNPTPEVKIEKTSFTAPVAPIEKSPAPAVRTETTPPPAAAVPAGPAPAPCLCPPAPAAEQPNDANIWEDPKVAGLMSGLINGKIEQLSPELDLSLKDGFSYPEADALTGTAGGETARVLASLAEKGLLQKKFYERLLLSPGGSAQLVPVERCPQCDSSELTRGELIEHFHCGHIGLESEFVQGLKQVCPKCKRELKLIGTDYRKPGLRYICDACHSIFPTPVIKCRCLKTGNVYGLEELQNVPLYTYRLNQAHRQRLEFELEPKRQLVDCLEHLGYDVQERVQVHGKSGAVHTIDLMASIDDLITRHTVAVGVLVAPQPGAQVSIDMLFGFDSKAYDAGIDNKMVIAVPGFTSEAMKFAERQGIRVYRLEDLRALLNWKIQETEIIAVKKEPPPAATGRTDLAATGPRGWLEWLLEKRGYHVAEKLKITGRSGAEHILDIYAEKDDGIINHKLAACVIVNEEGSNGDVNEVMQFDTAAYDARIRDKIIISVPRLSKEARQFADYQRIKVIEADELDDFAGQREVDDAARHLSTLLGKP
jgi:CheY-like chemotaxis protein